MNNGLKFVYTGNVHDPQGGTTWCPGCGMAVIERDWYILNAWNLTADGRCNGCGTACPGVFDHSPGDWGNKRQPVRLA
jgi:pyruvate formate lyase activating enzyme